MPASSRDSSSPADETETEARNDTPFSTQPLGRTASRLFTIVLLVTVLGGGAWMASFVVNVAREAESATSPSAPDSVQSIAPPSQPADTLRR